MWLLRTPVSRGRSLNVGFGSESPGNAEAQPGIPSALRRGGVSSTGGAASCQGPRSPLGASGTDPQTLCSNPKGSFYFLSEKTSSVLRKHRQGDQTQAGLLRRRLLRTGVPHVPAGERPRAALEPFPRGGRAWAARRGSVRQPGHPPREGHVQSGNCHPAGCRRALTRLTGHLPGRLAVTLAAVTDRVAAGLLKAGPGGCPWN